MREERAVGAPHWTTSSGPPGCVYYYGSGPPVLTSASPGVLSLGALAKQDQKLTLNGHSLDQVSAIEWNGQLIPAPAAGASSKTWNALTFQPPPVAGLGSATVRVIGPGGTSNPLEVEVGGTQPPVLFAPAWGASGSAVEWHWYGRPYDVAVLVYAVGPQTIGVGSWTLLKDFQLLYVQVLDANGTGGLNVTLPAGVALPFWLWTQLATLQAGHLFGASSIEQTFLLGG